MITVICKPVYEFLLNVYAEDILERYEYLYIVNCVKDLPGINLNYI